VKSIKSILVTGGAGFIGSFTVELLVEKGYDTRILDNLEPQVHGKAPDYLNPAAEFIRGDIRNRVELKNAIEGVDAVFHLAAAVGVGQSMYEIDKYVSVNTQSTATLLDILANEETDVKKLIVASSMSIYGEGKYECEKCGSVCPGLRNEKQLKQKEWEPKCPTCGKPLQPRPTDEEKPLEPTSIYAMTKRHQEEMCLNIGKTYGIPTVALRYFNVYGPRQALSNPYTGCCAIFSSRIMNGNSPYIFEDGMQTRDFVHVADVAHANLLALEKNGGNYQALNVGTGKPASIKKLADLLLRLLGSKLKPIILNEYRAGDVRHCYSDITRIEKTLGYKPTISIEKGLPSFVKWVKTQRNVVDRFEKAMKELTEKGLMSSR